LKPASISDRTSPITLTVTELANQNVITLHLSAEASGSNRPSPQPMREFISPKVNRAAAAFLLSPPSQFESAMSHQPQSQSSSPPAAAAVAAVVSLPASPNSAAHAVSSGSSQSVGSTASSTSSSAFALTVPSLPNLSVSRPSMSSPAPSSSSQPHPDVANQRVLVVEDSPFIRNLLAKSLTQLGYVHGFIQPRFSNHVFISTNFSAFSCDAFFL
jgi:CheY-like chemotaxis protein